MKMSLRFVCIALVLLMTLFVVAMPVFASTEDTAQETAVEESADAAATEKTKSAKAYAAAVVVGLAAAAGAVAMGMAITKSVDGIARQPEAEGKIRTTLMLGLVFVETAIIYALVVGILIIFVL